MYRLQLRAKTSPPDRLLRACSLLQVRAGAFRALFHRHHGALRKRTTAAHDQSASLRGPTLLEAGLFLSNCHDKSGRDLAVRIWRWSKKGPGGKLGRTASLSICRGTGRRNSRDPIGLCAASRKPAGATQAPRKAGRLLGKCPCLLLREGLGPGRCVRRRRKNRQQEVRLVTR